MASKRNRMLALDQRSGRLERAVNLLEDGYIRGLKVHRREADPADPRPVNVGPDRATLKLVPYREVERGSFLFTPGYWGKDDLTRQQLPCITLTPGPVVITAVASSTILAVDYDYVIVLAL